jgi:hypothetical protein
MDTVNIPVFHLYQILLRGKHIRSSMSSGPKVDGRSRPKATLFCPGCDHESHVDGDWVVRTTAARVTTECPDCGTRIDERSRRPDRSDECSPSVGPASALGAFAPVNVVIRFQRYVLGWWSRHRTRYASSRSSA